MVLSPFPFEQCPKERWFSLEIASLSQLLHCIFIHIKSLCYKTLTKVVTKSYWLVIYSYFFTFHTSFNSTICPIPPLAATPQYQRNWLVYGDCVPLERVNRSYRFSNHGRPIPAAVNVTHVLVAVQCNGIIKHTNRAHQCQWPCKMYGFTPPFHVPPL